MFHVVFNVNESYIKYFAVMCYSIILNADMCYSIILNADNGRKEDEGFHFHVLTDRLSSETQAKIKELQARLTEIYPCKIDVYFLSDEDFQGFPKLNDNYLTYFRLKVAKVLPQEIQKCLYLDVDMLCLSDIREIFSIDLSGKVCAVVKDAHYQPARIMKSRDESRGGGGIALALESYFNAGLILIDLQEWRERRIEERCFEFLQSYIPEWHDQDTLNAILEKEVLLLPLEWNFMMGHFEANGACFKGSRNHTLSYTEEEYLLARKRVKIMHFVTPRKPWMGGDFRESFYRSKWWDLAFQTPIFSDELRLMHFRAFEETLIGLGRMLEKQHQSRKISVIVKKAKREIKRFFESFKANRA